MPQIDIMHYESITSVCFTLPAWNRFRSTHTLHLSVIVRYETPKKSTWFILLSFRLSVSALQMQRMLSKQEHDLGCQSPLTAYELTLVKALNNCPR